MANTITINKPINIMGNKPLDARQIVDCIDNYKSIQYPWVGMPFYSVAEKKWYQVISLIPGYLVYATGKIEPNLPSGTLYKDYEVVQNAFIGEYKDLIDAVLKGEKGDPGPTGPSAYDIAVKNGFKGTEPEWLLSLHGSDAGGMIPASEQDIRGLFKEVY